MMSLNKKFIKKFWNLKNFSHLTSYLKGLKSEKIAINYLKNNAWKILSKNYKTKVGEIDIIAYKDNVIVAFEVKYRNNLDSLFFSINDKQKKRVKNAFLLFLQKKTYYNKTYLFRIDAILIDSNYKINHIQNAWE